MDKETKAEVEIVKKATLMANSRFKSVWQLMAEADANGGEVEVYDPSDRECFWQERGNLDTALLRSFFKQGLLRIKPNSKTKTYAGHVIVDLTTDRIVSNYAFDASKNRHTLLPNQVLATLSYGPVEVVDYGMDGLPV